MALIGEMHYLTIGDSTYSIPVSGGSTVTITTDLTSGTKTATIGVNGQSYDLYAPTPNTGTITNVKTTAGAHTTIDVSSGVANFNVPTKTSHLTNDSGFITSYTDTKVTQTVDNTTNAQYSMVFSPDHNTATEELKKTSKLNWSPMSSTLTIADKTVGSSGISKVEINPIGINLYNSNNYYARIALTSGRTSSGVLYLPKKDGTIALTSDIPTVPTNVSAFTNDAGYLTSYTETDPTVPAWAKASTKPTYTASEVGALPDTTTIPTNTSDLTNDSGFVTTDEKLKTSTISTNTQYYPVLGNYTSTPETKYYSGNFRYSKKDNVDILQLGQVSSSSTGKGQIILCSGPYYTYLQPPEYDTLSSSATYTLPASTGTIALTSDIPTVPTSTGNATTGITASTTATKTTLGTANSVTGVQSSTTTASKVTLGTAISIYGVKSGTNSTTIASKASGGNGSASNWVFEDVSCDDITNWVAGSGSFTQGSFTGGSIVVNNHVMSFTPATHGADSHSHTAPTLSYTAKTGSHVKSGGNGTAPTWSFTDVTVPIRADSATSIPNVTAATDVTVPIKNTSSTSIPNVSVTSATVSITDNGHTHSI